MIRKATIKDLDELSTMLYALYKEIVPDYATHDMGVYRTTIIQHLNNKKEYVFIEEGRGFLVLRDETEPMAPEMYRYNWMRVYIKPKYRYTKLLAKFYKFIFKEFPKGDILGATEMNSPHIKVLDKRHECIAKVYKLNRSKT